MKARVFKFGDSWVAVCGCCGYQFEAGPWDLAMFWARVLTDNCQPADHARKEGAR